MKVTQLVHWARERKPTEAFAAFIVVRSTWTRAACRANYQRAQSSPVASIDQNHWEAWRTKHTWGGWSHYRHLKEDICHPIHVLCVHSLKWQDQMYVSITLAYTEACDDNVIVAVSNSRALSPTDGAGCRTYVWACRLDARGCSLMWSFFVQAWSKLYSSWLNFGSHGTKLTC